MKYRPAVDGNWQTLCCDLKSYWGGFTNAAPQPRICLPDDEMNLCWFLSQNEPLPIQIERLPGTSITVWQQVPLTRRAILVPFQNLWKIGSRRHGRSAPPASPLSVGNSEVLYLVDRPLRRMTRSNTPIGRRMMGLRRRSHSTRRADYKPRPVKLSMQEFSAVSLCPHYV